MPHCRQQMCVARLLVGTLGHGLLACQAAEEPSGAWVAIVEPFEHVRSMAESDHLDAACIVKYVSRTAV